MNSSPDSRLIFPPIPAGRQPLLWAALAFAGGISIGVYAWRPPIWWLVTWIVFVAAAAYLLRRRRRSAFILGLGALFVLGALMVQVRIPGNAGDSALLQYADGSETLVTAHVTKEGTLQQERPGDIRQRLDVETEQVVRGNESFEVHSGLRISVYDQQPSRSPTAPDQPAKTDLPSVRLFHYGERLRFPAKLSLPRNFRNPGAFDYQAYLAENGIAALASAKSSDVEILPGFSGSGSNSGALEFIAASSRKFMPCGSRPRLPSWTPW
ncbi:MAG TPA: ComEC/Rec2 family competence protein [Terriglobales bacterium]|jgi:competence protein ComEC|nr:ComEC/Rec2 family competence protein [Terriglobales bacterium]